MTETSLSSCCIYIMSCNIYKHPDGSDENNLLYGHATTENKIHNPKDEEAAEGNGGEKESTERAPQFLRIRKGQEILQC